MERILRTTNPHSDRQDWHNVRRLLPFLWEYRGRVLVALLSLLLAKLANVGVPLALKHVVDTLDRSAGNPAALPIVLLLAYGVLKLSSAMFNELRDAVFAKVRYRAMRRVSTQVLRHLHALSLRFHLERRTGAVSRDVERGTSSVSTILNYMIFNIIPTAVEFGLVALILLSSYDPQFALVIFGTVALYILFTLAVTEWRMHFRHEMNALDSQANNQALDSLMNYETVKYFSNEDFELRRYDATLAKWEDAAVKSQTSMSALNFGQGAIIALGATVVMIFAARQVVQGSMSLGDLVLVNAFLLQLFMPLNFLGIVYRQIKYSLADMDSMFKLVDTPPEIVDAADARGLVVSAGVVHFAKVDFSYREDRPTLHGIDLEIPAGHKVAVVGTSGAGKSTLARLLFRFYAPTGGRILIDGQDIASVTQRSLRQAVGIVPQDTVLFNDSIYYNIHYADPATSREQVEGAARLAHIHEFIMSLPEGYDTVVGERGLKLSGGEKQRVAIARAVLKNPRILVFDEATSALDSHSEQAILDALREVAQHHTTLAIAHRLSTIVDADTILVMEQGRIVERGSHAALLQAGGRYAHMWALQQRERREAQFGDRLYALQSA